MKRRAILAGGAATALLAQAGAFAQLAGRSYRVGVLLPLAGLAAQPYMTALREQLATHGFIEGSNLTLVARFDASRSEVREIVVGKPDAIFVCTTVLSEMALSLSNSLPVVFAWVADPVVSGLAKTHRRPGGRATGVAARFFELTSKRFELLRELLPSAKRVAVAAGTFDTTLETVMRYAQDAAERLDFDLIRIEAGAAWSLALSVALENKADAVLVVTPFAQFGMRFAAEEVVKFMLENRMPVMFTDVDAVDLGGLISYGNNLSEDVRRAADLLARILQGESPGEIAIDQASRFELAVNMRTARAIGIAVPQSILLRADQVIE